MSEINDVNGDAGRFPLLSVIIGAGSEPDSLAHTLALVSKQNYPCIEVILVNDSENDVSWLIDEYQNHFIHLHYLVLGPDESMPGSGKSGLDAAGGKYIIRLDDDTFFDRDYIRDLVDSMRDMPDIAGVYIKERHIPDSELVMVKNPFSRISYRNIEDSWVKRQQKNNDYPVEMVRELTISNPSGRPADEIDNLKKAVALADRQLRNMETELESLTDELDALRSSTSWRLTGPVRKLILMIRRGARLFRYKKHTLTLLPNDQINVADDGAFLCIGDDPQLDCVSSLQRMPSGWVRLAGKIRSDQSINLELHIADEEGFSPDNSRAAGIGASGAIDELYRFPDIVTALRLEILGCKDRFTIQNLQITEVSSLQVLIRYLSANKPGGMLATPVEMVKQAQKAWHLYRTKGINAVMARIMKKPDITDYLSWVKAYSTLTSSDRNQIIKRIKKMAYTPLISVIMPVYNARENTLLAAVESVKNQLYPNWELCIADDASTLPHIRTVLESYSEGDERIKLVFREKNGYISACSNSALDLANGDFIALLDHDDKLAPHALYMVAETLDQYPDADIIYSDEDKIDQDGMRFSPHFKPDWNPELFYSINYISHLGVYRTPLVRAVDGFRTGMEGSQDYDLALRCVAKTRHERIHHIPHILYHWRATTGSTALDTTAKDYATAAGIKALTDYFSGAGTPIHHVEETVLPTTYRLRFALDSEPRVALILPTRNNHTILKKCLDSIVDKTAYKNYEILVVNNRSDDPDTLAYLQQAGQMDQIRVIDYDHPFNYSAINNFAVSQSNSDLIGLINDDIEVISPEWLSEMAGYAVHPDVGAVGAKLLYPDDRIQHAGVILGLGGVAGHSHKYVSDSDHGYFSRLSLPQALSAVTAACMILRRKVYEEVGGLNEVNLKIAFNDVDFCLRIREAGYRNVWTPYAKLYHHESISRGYEDTVEKQIRFGKEIAFMKRRWGALLRNDPYYNPNLTDANGDFGLAVPSRAKKPWKKFISRRGEFNIQG